MRWHRTLAFFLILTSVFTMMSCGGAAAEDAWSVVNRLCENEADLPNGEYYVYGIEGADLLDEAMLVGMFGDGRIPSELDEAQTGACYLSYTQPFELTVFCAKSSHGAQLLSQMLLRRKEILARYWATQGVELEGEAASVTVCGKWVLLAYGAGSATERFCRIV